MQLESLLIKLLTSQVISFSQYIQEGETLILDRKKGSLINGVVAKPSLNLTKGNTKGGGIKNNHGNILVGPDAYEQPFREDYSTNQKF